MNASSEGGLSPYQQLVEFQRKAEAGCDQYERECVGKAQAIVQGLRESTQWEGEFRMSRIAEMEEWGIPEEVRKRPMGFFYEDGRYVFQFVAQSPENGKDELHLGYRWVLKKEGGSWVVTTPDLGGSPSEPVNVDNVEASMPDILARFMALCRDAIGDSNFMNQWGQQEQPEPVTYRVKSQRI